MPGFLPDVEDVRSDLLDYALEIEWFDEHLGRMIRTLEEAGELDNTVIIVTSDNGMAFPRAKANLYEHGIHVPLVIRWGGAPGGRNVHDLVGFVDLTATILDVAGVEAPGAPAPPVGRSLLPLLRSKENGRLEPGRAAVAAGRERHSSSRYRSLGYPQRALRTADHLYIRNFHPERWPAGAPRKVGKGNYPTADEVKKKILGPEADGFHDIDAAPSLDVLVAGRDDPELRPLFELAVAKRPAEELYHIRRDPFCLRNLAGDPGEAATLEALRRQLEALLEATGDPRVTGRGDVFETYPRYSRIRVFPEPDWARSAPERVPEQPWLDARMKELEGR